VPAQAVGNKDGVNVVYLVRNSKVERRAVRLGAKTNTGQVVLAGLQAGNEVAVGELDKLSDGAPVRIDNPKEHAP
jgi:hypothetical protein